MPGKNRAGAVLQKRPITPFRTFRRRRVVQNVSGKERCSLFELPQTRQESGDLLMDLSGLPDD